MIKKYVLRKNLRTVRCFCEELFMTYDQFYRKYTFNSSPMNSYDMFRNYNNPAMDSIKKNIQGVTIVRDKESAMRALDTLYKYSDRVVSWDTEVVDIDIKNFTPVSSGKIISAQGFAGPDVDFGNGPRLFIDNFADASDVLIYFKDYFENAKMKKAWFNYGFDRHVFYNHDIDCQGFAGDVMHMARLVNPSSGPKYYSLSA